jgi:hypothetical protein
VTRRRSGAGACDSNEMAYRDGGVYSETVVRQTIANNSFLKEQWAQHKIAVSPLGAEGST